jgi:signal transduction histidine kinase
MRGMRTSLSLQVKLLLSFGGVVLFACGLALFWGFIQYKNLVTGFSSRQADLGLQWLQSEVQAAAAGRSLPPNRDLAERVLLGVDMSTAAPNAVYYYHPDARTGRELALGGGPMGAPRLPWYARAQVRQLGEGAVKVGSLGLSGRHGRLDVQWGQRRYDLGAVAVFLPSYAGRGPTIERPLKELLVFFLALFGVCGGIAVLTVGEFVKPIRKLEERADGMARGELAQPVTSGGESDEIGRLTYALEEMRRALGEKLRSTEEVNLDLERAVQRRTADLAKKNRELAETLEKLTRAQDQLVRAEKMASIGQLVAGIAHEINNPVNAIVNTVAPLEDALRELAGVDAAEVDELRDMIRVIRRGAHRTKDIVQALHNYSRTDEESVVLVDLNRSLDDSLELLRHLLKGTIRVEREYDELPRLRGHAGQLNQVFMNLLTNAAQALAGRQDGTIWVRTRAAARAAVIEIRDNGPGITPDVLPRIFDPFFTTKEVGDGTGLGLSIVHGIVERHGGSIEVASVVGQGTTFTVSIPFGDPNQS